MPVFDLLNSQFSRQAKMRPRRTQSGETGKVWRHSHERQTPRY